MLQRVMLVAAMLLLTSGCASKFKTVDCKGPVVALNPSHWTPTASDVAVLASFCPEEK